MVKKVKSIYGNEIVDQVAREEIKEKIDTTIRKEDLDDLKDKLNLQKYETVLTGDAYRLEVGSINRTTCLEEDSDTYMRSNFIEVPKAGSYTIYSSDPETPIVLFKYDEDKQPYLQWNEGYSYSFRFDQSKIDLDCKYIRFRVNTINFDLNFDIVSEDGISILKHTEEDEVVTSYKHKKIDLLNQHSIRSDEIDGDESMHEMVLSSKESEFCIVTIKPEDNLRHEATLCLNIGSKGFVDLSCMKYNDNRSPEFGTVLQSRGGNPLPYYYVAFNNGNGEGRVKKFLIESDAVPVFFTSQGIKMRKTNDFDNNYDDNEDFITITPEIAEYLVNAKDKINEASNKIDEVSNRYNNIDVLSSRMDTFTSLPTGSTSADAELIDIRTDVNGKVHASAGTAVREQVNKLSSEIDNVENDVSYKEKEYIVKNVAIPQKTAGSITKICEIDAIKKFHISLKNTDQSLDTGHFNIVLRQDNIDRQFLGTKVVNKNNTVEWYSMNWYDNTYGYSREFCLDTLKIAPLEVYVKQTTKNSCEVSVWYDTDSDFSKPILNTERLLIVDTNSKLNNRFRKISDAVEYAKRVYDAKEPITIFVKNGNYVEEPTNDFPYAPINIADANISIIGESMDNVIVSLTNSATVQSRLMHIGGNQTVKNLTLKVLADTSYNGNTGNNPYVIHNDDTYNDYDEHYTTTVENCVLYSECYNPVGGGLHEKQTQIYKNVTTIWNGEHDTGTNQGSFYVHAPSTSQMPDGILIDNCTFISKNGEKALSLPNTSDGIRYAEIPVTIRRTILSTNGTVEVDSNFKELHPLLTSDSKMNSNSLINY